MNKTLRRLAAVMMVMFVVLMGSATAIQFFQAEALNANPRNARAFTKQFNNARGPIVVGGVPIAESVPVDSSFGFQRVFGGGDPAIAEMYAHVTGYFSISRGTSGIERQENEFLNGQAPALWVDRVHNMLTGQVNRGSSVELTLDGFLQQVSWEAMNGQRGSVMAIDTRTGAIRSMVSYPSFDPNPLAVHSTSLANERYNEVLYSDHRPMDNRVLRQVHPPGSTFKMIVAAAALEAGYTINTQLPAPHRFRLPNTTHYLRNFGDRTCSPTGQGSMYELMVISCNTSFAMLALELGEDRIRDMAQRFGFGENFRVPMWSVASRFPEAGDAFTADRLALAAIGQGDVMVTPLVMGLMAAAIANDGVMMQPYLVQTIRDPNLEVIFEAEPQALRQVVSPEVAAGLTEMMIGSVRDWGSTGWRARIPGVDVAGKTGTAQTARGVAPHTWFTVFAPAEDPVIAVVVMIENGGHMGMDGTAASVAVPIAHRVLLAALGLDADGQPIGPVEPDPEAGGEQDDILPNEPAEQPEAGGDE
ncbi:MAG: penicillin-binding transpeptidase domain-containing protein [Promicromonosporaceae bacterium]|nr:penicillin-binding transpeptidase domain-containing protein [Promicromonosporaceae bacterium]